LGGLPININSWYRSQDLNHAVGSKPTSDHITGFAIDFTCPKFGDPRRIVEAIKASNIQFSQLIWEFSSWVHVSFNGSKRQVLTIDKDGTRVFT
jgi:putative chitinase